MNPKNGSPSNLITDRWATYNEAIAKLLPSTKHLPVKTMSSNINSYFYLYISL